MISFTSKPQTGEDASLFVIRPLRPMVFNFFISDKPENFEQTIDQIESSTRTHHSQKLQQKNNLYFQPKIIHKKLNEEPKFRLSVEKKKTKIALGLGQKAVSQRPSRNSYRGSKIKTSIQLKSMFNDQQIQISQNTMREQKIQSQQLPIQISPRKKKQPHLHFNLKHVLQASKEFRRDYSKQDNIQGSNFPYYQYFSSQKSSIPSSQKSARLRMEKHMQKQRYVSTTVGVRQFHYEL